MDWTELEARKIKPPFNPGVVSPMVVPLWHVPTDRPFLQHSQFDLKNIDKDFLSQSIPSKSSSFGTDDLTQAPTFRFGRQPTFDDGQRSRSRFRRLLLRAFSTFQRP